MHHLLITDENMQELAELINKTPAAIPTHLQAYCGDEVLLQWFDASARDPIFVSHDISQSAVQAFCDRLGCKATAWEP
jgi:hypothetical protein